jgi:hypothetical protein
MSQVSGRAFGALWMDSGMRKKARIKALEAHVNLLFVALSTALDEMGAFYDATRQFEKEMSDALLEMHKHLEDQIEMRVQRINAPLN